MDRDIHADSIKGLLILMVILGHIVGACGIGKANEDVWFFIYTFHMPLFAIISGYLTKRKSDICLFYRGLYKIILPLVIFQLLYVFCSILFLDSSPSLLFFVRPYWIMWYLLSLVFWRLFLQFTPVALLSRPYLYIATCILFSVLCGLVPKGFYLSFWRTISFYPFFLFGYYMRQKMVKFNMRKGLASFLLIIVILLTAFNIYPPTFVDIDTAKIMLRGVGLYGLLEMPVKLLFVLVSFLLSIAIYTVVPFNNFLSHFGRESMYYYLYHGFLVRFILYPNIVKYSLPQSFIFVLIYWIIIVLILHVLNRIRFLVFLTNPYK